MITYLVIAAILLAITFDVMNGFHDAANSIATIVATKVLTPIQAVFWAAFFNFVPIAIFTPTVANTIAKIVKVQPNDWQYFLVICAGLMGATLWNLLTWWLGLPTSSSHALIGGLSGAGITYAGLSALQWHMLFETILFIVLAPLIGFILGFIIIVCVYWLNSRTSPTKVDKKFRRLQLLSAALYSIGHGANDAQKTMGVIFALLIASGFLNYNSTLSLKNPDTAWIIFVCHFAMSLGTCMGGWRIVKTMGMKIAKLKPIDGFSAETAGAFTLFLATELGIPVSTTHTITGAIIGISSAVKPFSHIKWKIAGKIMWSWILTIPLSGLIAAAIFYILYLSSILFRF
ncbi:Low-affinity inorganic phosphate transporter 1 [Candidatus Rubidus massiliensis]|nr:Low-affinity inorganic phosphate transporter 1 [Candidatus Rubidus massiliensis]